MSNHPFPLDSASVEHAIDAMAASVAAELDTDVPTVVIGIRRGGAAIARRLAAELHRRHPLEADAPGELNIAFYRDDFGSRGLHPVVGPSSVTFDIDNRQVVLVDDVLSSGRTVRAALNEIFDFGRPARVLLAVLVERKGHELPIRADVAHWQVALEKHENVALDPDTLAIEIVTR